MTTTLFHCTNEAIKNKNPTDAIEKHKKVPRARYITTQEEIFKLLKAIVAEKNKTMVDFFLMLLFT